MSPSQARAVSEARERRQIVAGLLAAVEDRGPRALRESDVIEAAETTPWTFRAHFDDLDACFDFACEAGLDTLLSPMVASWSVPRPAATRLAAAVTALLGSLAAQPRLAELCLLRSPARQPDRHTYRRAVEALAELLLDLGPQPRPVSPRAAADGAALAAEAIGLIAARLARGDAADLGCLQPRILALLHPALEG